MRHLGKAAFILALATGLAAAGANAQTMPPAGSGAAPAEKPAAAAKPMKHHRAAAMKPASITEGCDVDIALFCGDLESKGARVTKCLNDNKALVSSGCGAALGKGR